MRCMFPSGASSSGSGRREQAPGAYWSAWDRLEPCIYLANICESSRGLPGASGTSGLTLLEVLGWGGPGRRWQQW